MLWCGKPIKEAPPPPTYDQMLHYREIAREAAPAATAVGGLAVMGASGLTSSVLAAPAFLWMQRSLIRGQLVSPVKSLEKVRRVKYLDKKNVIVTGASSGIGAQLAVQFALMGANVIGVCRRHPAEARAYVDDVVARQWVGGHPMKRSILMARIKFEHTDFNSLDHVRRFVAETSQAPWAVPDERGNGGLHILVNAAGVMESGKPQRTLEGMEQHLQVNFLAPFMLTEGLAPLLANARDDSGFLGGRVINVVSSSHEAIADAAKAKAMMEDGARFGGEDGTDVRLESEACDETKGKAIERYALSKLMQICHSDSLAARGVCSACVSPGPALTGIYRSMAPWATGWAARNVLQALAMKTAAEGSATAYDCSLRDDIVNGGYYADMQVRDGRSALACDPAFRDEVVRWGLHQAGMKDPATLTAEQVEAARPHSMLFRRGDADFAARCHRSRGALLPPLLQSQADAAEQ